MIAVVAFIPNPYFERLFGSYSTYQPKYEGFTDVPQHEPYGSNFYTLLCTYSRVDSSWRTPLSGFIVAMNLLNVNIQILLNI